MLISTNSCTLRWGRRRPFILFGAVLCGIFHLSSPASKKSSAKLYFAAIGMAIIGYSGYIGDAIGDSDGDSVGDHWKALIFAVHFASFLVFIYYQILKDFSTTDTWPLGDEYGC